VKRNGKPKSRTDKLLHSTLDNEDTASKAGGISATELLQKLGSKNISDSAKFLLLGLLISVSMNKMRLSDLATLFDKLFLSTLWFNRGGVDFDLSERGQKFLKEYKIAEKGMRIVAKIISGVPLREFPNQLGISSRTVNKRTIMIGGLCNN
jgi:hypothetical protein